MVKNRKNTVKGKGYVVLPIEVGDVELEADFGTFKISRTKSCIAYTNYVGYSVITKPYTTTPKGISTELSLYSWLNYALESKEYLESHKEDIHPDFGITCGEWLEQIKIITEANVTKPCVVFTDVDYACEEALKHIEWLNEKAKDLQLAMTTPPEEEDEKKVAEYFGDAISTDNLIEQTREEQ